MSYSERDLEIWKRNELKPEDTFSFECKMCGSCCRKREEPILITGADVYRISRALGTTMMETVITKTTSYIGDVSHMPVLILKERFDGSCPLLRKGKCIVHQDKPTVCALFPLGRFYDSSAGEFHYFLNSNSCQATSGAGRFWTLQDWLDKFEIEKTEKMTQAWNRLIGGIVAQTHKMRRDKIQGRLLEILLSALYFDYDTGRPYIEQVEEHMVVLVEIFKKEFHKKITFIEK